MITLNLYSLGEFKDTIITENYISIFKLKKLISTIINCNIFEFNLINIELLTLLIPYHKQLHHFFKDNDTYDVYYIKYDIETSYILSCIHNHYHINNISHFDNHFKIINKNKSIILELLNKDYKYLSYLSDDIKNDKEIILYALEINALSLDYASDELKDDTKIVIKAINKEPFALEYASKRLKNDINIVLSAIKKNGFVYEYISKELKNNKEIFLEALKYNNKYIGTIYKYASQNLRDDKEILITVLNTSPNRAYTNFLIGYASNRLKNIFL